MNLFPPQKLRLKEVTDELEVTWKNGEVYCIAADDLRRYCACSSCRARQLVGVRLVTESSKIVAINLIAQQAVQVVFADGHDRGIFPWPYLNAIAVGRVQDFLNV
ncbi:MAG TPA: gamma-butyrobetaine hydroxylase-like domain-containing protein [Marinagarivorans sp.]